MASSDDSKKCAFCSKDTTSRICAGCNGAPNPPSAGLVKTIYCDATCQKAHWDAHKVACKAHQARKILYRAGETAQMAFYMFREKTYDQKIERVEKKGNCLFLFEGYYNDSSLLIPFPHHLLPNERDKQAALTFLTCGESIAYMHELFKIMLKGTYSSIVEVVVKTQPPTRPLKMVRPNGPDNKDYGHEIMQITLKSGEVYAVDITGAQHGSYESVYPWHQYLQTRVRIFGETLSFGSLKAKYCGEERCKVPGYQGLIRKMQKECAETFDDAVGEWQERGVKVGEMLRMGEGAFVRTREELMAYVAGALQDHTRFFEAQMRGRMRVEVGEEVS